MFQNIGRAQFVIPNGTTKFVSLMNNITVPRRSRLDLILPQKTRKPTRQDLIFR